MIAVVTKVMVMMMMTTLPVFIKSRKVYFGAEKATPFISWKQTSLSSLNVS